MCPHSFYLRGGLPGSDGVGKYVLLSLRGVGAQGVADTTLTLTSPNPHPKQRVQEITSCESPLGRIGSSNYRSRGVAARVEDHLCCTWIDIISNPNPNPTYAFLSSTCRVLIVLCMYGYVELLPPP